MHLARACVYSVSMTYTETLALDFEALVAVADVEYELWNIAGGDPQRIVSREIEAAIERGSITRLRSVLMHILRQRD